MDFSAITHRNLHHAYFIEGEHEYVVPRLLEYLENEGIAKKDAITVNTIPVFYIENSRDLRASQQMVSDGRRIIIIAFDRIIEAAEQALLKTLEEPTVGTHFFFVSRNSNALLETVRSRMFIIRPLGRKDNIEGDLGAKEYLTSDYYGRSEFLKDMIAAARGDDDESDDERAVARRSLVQFLDCLERVSVDFLHEGKFEYGEPLEHIILAKRDLNDASPSIKMIFEHLSLRLPRIKK